MNNFLKNLIITILLFAPSVPALAGETYRLKIAISAETPIAGEELIVSVEAQDKDKNRVETESRDLKMILANGEVITEYPLKLIEGKTSLKIAFDRLGATLIRIFDPENPALVGFAAFDVTEKRGDVQ